MAWTVFPFFYGLYISFFQIDFGSEDRFIGLGNYYRFFSDDNALNAVEVTFLFVIGSVAVQVILGLLLALMANRPSTTRGLVRTLLILQLFATPVAVGFLFLFRFQSRDSNNTRTFPNDCRFPAMAPQLAANPRGVLREVADAALQLPHLTERWSPK